MKIATPAGYEPDDDVLAVAGNRVSLGNDPAQAVQNADLIVTDVWASMGQEEEQKKRMQKFAKYQVNSDIMELANSDALFMHCLPAHRGEEVSENVLEGPQSVVWEEAGNRLHSQKALLEFLIS